MMDGMGGGMMWGMGSHVDRLHRGAGVSRCGACQIPVLAPVADR